MKTYQNFELFQTYSDVAPGSEQLILIQNPCAGAVVISIQGDIDGGAEVTAAFSIDEASYQELLRLMKLNKSEADLRQWLYDSCNDCLLTPRAEPI